MDDPLEARSTREAVAVSEYNGKALIIGDETKEEWITVQGIRTTNVESVR